MSTYRTIVGRYEADGIEYRARLTAGFVRILSRPVALPAVPWEHRSNARWLDGSIAEAWPMMDVVVLSNLSASLRDESAP